MCCNILQPPKQAHFPRLYVSTMSHLKANSNLSKLTRTNLFPRTRRLSENFICGRLFMFGGFHIKQAAFCGELVITLLSVLSKFISFGFSKLIYNISLKDDGSVHNRMWMGTVSPPKSALFFFVQMTQHLNLLLEVDFQIFFFLKGLREPLFFVKWTNSSSRCSFAEILIDSLFLSKKHLNTLCFVFDRFK